MPPRVGPTGPLDLYRVVGRDIVDGFAAIAAPVSIGVLSDLSLEAGPEAAFFSRCTVLTPTPCSSAALRTLTPVSKNARIASARPLSILGRPKCFPLCL